MKKSDKFFAVIIPILSLSVAIMVGVITTYYEELFKNNWLITCVVFAVSMFLLQVFLPLIVNYKENNSETQKALINNILRNISKSVFPDTDDSDYENLPYCTTIHICKHKYRKVEYYYNHLYGNPDIEHRFPKYFGDVGITCIKNKKRLTKLFNAGENVPEFFGIEEDISSCNKVIQFFKKRKIAKLKKMQERATSLIPSDLIGILAFPIANKAKTKIYGVLEFDFFTHEQSVIQKIFDNGHLIGTLCDWVNILKSLM